MGNILLIVEMRIQIRTRIVKEKKTRLTCLISYLIRLVELCDY